MANRYFKVSADSETGKKFAEFYKTLRSIRKQQKALSEKYGFDQWKESNHGDYGVITGVLFNNITPDKTIWKKHDKESMYPKSSSIIGRQIIEEFEQVETMDRYTPNKIVGYDGGFFHQIGYHYKVKGFYGFQVGDDWNFKPKKDQIEITVTEYQKLFK